VAAPVGLRAGATRFFPELSDGQPEPVFQGNILTISFNAGARPRVLALGMVVFRNAHTGATVIVIATATRMVLVP